MTSISKRRADNLTKKLAEVNRKYEFVRQLPTEAQVADWIEDAKALPRVTTY